MLFLVVELTEELVRYEGPQNACALRYSGGSRVKYLRYVMAYYVSPNGVIEIVRPTKGKETVSKTDIIRAAVENSGK